VEAQGHLLEHSWWDASYQEEGTCTFVGGDPLPTCLPAGTYTARYRYTYVKDGTTHTVHLPTITMTITP